MDVHVVDRLARSQPGQLIAGHAADDRLPLPRFQPLGEDCAVEPGKRRGPVFHCDRKLLHAGLELLQRFDQ